MNGDTIRILRGLLTCVAGAAVWIEAAAVCGADAAAEAAKKTDFAGVDALLKAGDYEAAAAAAGGIAESVKPKPRDDDYLSRSIELIRALMRKGYAELRLGHADAADAAFADASRTFKDGEFKRLVVLATRQARTGVPPWLIDLELAGSELLSARRAVLLLRLGEQAAIPAAVAGDDAGGVAERRKQIADWLEDMDLLRTSAADARESFVKRFGAVAGVAATSPYAKSLVGPFRESLLDGLVALEKSRLPSTTDEERSRLRTDATRRFEAAAATLEAVVLAVTPKAGGMRPELRVEVALLEIELLTARARLLIESGDLALARKDVDKVVELRREVGVLQKNPAADSHPELYEPLLLAAEIGVAESRRLLEAGMVDEARAEMADVRKKIDQAERLTLPAEHAFRHRLAAAGEALVAQQGNVEALVPRTNAVDAAARRLLRGLGASAVAAPKSPAPPAQPADTLP